LPRRLDCSFVLVATIARVDAWLSEDNRRHASQSLEGISETAKQLPELAREVCEEADVEPEHVYEITVCGNVTMMQLALGQWRH
jgi:hypothetical protein